MGNWKIIDRDGRAPTVYCQAGRDDVAAFVWTDDLMRVAIHLNGTVSVRRFARGHIFDRIILDGRRLFLSRRWPTDLRGHPVWKIWYDTTVMTLQEFEDALIALLT